MGKTERASEGKTERASEGKLERASERKTERPSERKIERPSEQITVQVTSWPGVSAGPGRRGEFAFKVAGHEIGHLHGDHAAHFLLPAEIGLDLKEQGRVIDHPVFPGKPGPSARRISNQADVDAVIELMRLNYDRIVARYGTSDEEPETTTRVA